MESETILVKKYSNIGELQKEHKTTYAIVRNEKGVKYGISVEEDYNGYIINSTNKHLTDDEQIAKQITLYLFENAVSANMLYDVLHDCKVCNVV
ncbi:MAG: DUF6514 family protein [Oscillospiraceae bacterium]